MCAQPISGNFLYLYRTFGANEISLCRFENWHPDLSPLHPMNMTMDDVDTALRYTVTKENFLLFARKFDHNTLGGVDVLNYVDLLRQTTTIPSEI